MAFFGGFWGKHPRDLGKKGKCVKIESKTRHHLHASSQICDVDLTWGEVFLTFFHFLEIGKKAVCRRILAVWTPDRLGRFLNFRRKFVFYQSLWNFLGSGAILAPKRGLFCRWDFFDAKKWSKIGIFGREITNGSKDHWREVIFGSFWLKMTKTRVCAVRKAKKHA